VVVVDVRLNIMTFTSTIWCKFDGSQAISVVSGLYTAHTRNDEIWNIWHDPSFNKFKFYQQSFDQYYLPPCILLASPIVVCYSRNSSLK
jgi:hypothetical protein